MAVPVEIADETTISIVPVYDKVNIDGVDRAVLQLSVNATASGDNTLLVAVPGCKIRVLGVSVAATAAVSVAWKSGASNTMIQAMGFAASGQLNVERVVGYWMETNPGESLVLNLSATTNVRGALTYVLL
jgi:hypothetical protein